MTALDDVEFINRYGPGGPPSNFTAHRACDGTGWDLSGNAVDDRCTGCGGTGRVHGLRARVDTAAHALYTDLRFARRQLLRLPYLTRTVRRYALAGSHPLSYEQRTYADRLDVAHPWLWNRVLALKVLLNLTHHQRQARKWRRAQRRQR